MITSSATLPQQFNSMALACQNFRQHAITCKCFISQNPKPHRLCRPHNLPHQYQHLLHVTNAASAAAVTSVSTTPPYVGVQTWAQRVTTGVPLLELFKTLTLTQAATTSALLVCLATALTAHTKHILNAWALYEEDRMEDRETMLNTQVVAGAALVALRGPVGVLLPWLYVSMCSTIAACFFDVAVQRVQAGAAAQLPWVLHKAVMAVASQPVAGALRDLTQLFQDMTEVSFIAFMAWFLVAWKDEVKQTVLTWAELEGTLDADNLARVISPVSTLLSVFIILAAMLMSIKTAGFDIGPLLAFSSMGTLAVGIAAQTTISNIGSALSLYLSQPFRRGDQIQLKSLSGERVIKGTVDRILPMQTVIFTDELVPIYINNKDIVDGMMIVNESKTGKMLESDLPNHFEDKILTVRYVDVDKVPGIEQDATEYIESHPDMLLQEGVTNRCRLQGFNLYGAELSLQYTLSQAAFQRRSAILSEIMTRIDRIVRSHGALLAMEEGVEYPDTLKTSKN